MPKRLDYNRVAPEAVKALAATKPYIQSSEIPARLRALVELRTSQINGCAYCVDMHSREARAALAWAESVTLVSQTGVPDGVFEDVQRQFTEKEVVDLTFIIATMNAWNRIAISFRQGPMKREA